MVMTTQTNTSKKITSKKYNEIFSDFGSEFSLDIPCLLKGLDGIMIGYLFSFQERDEHLTDHQYDTIHYVNRIRTYMFERLIDSTGNELSVDAIEKMFSDFGEEFCYDIPCLLNGLDNIMVEYLFSFQERKIDLCDHQYNIIHYANWLRTYISKKLIKYATQGK